MIIYIIYNNITKIIMLYKTIKKKNIKTTKVNYECLTFGKYMKPNYIFQNDESKS